MNLHGALCLQVRLEDVLFEDRGATLLWTVQRLPALTDLDIRFEGSVPKLQRPVSDDNGLPRCGELAELHSRSLTRLSVSTLSGARDVRQTLHLVGLPELRFFQLQGAKPMPAAARIEVASFRGTPKLQELHLQDIRAPLPLEVGSLDQLTALTALSLKGCGLRRVPDSVWALSSTLCVLDLSNNGRLQIDAAAVANIVECSKLRTLGLYKPSIHDWSSKLDGAVWEGISHHMVQEGYAPAQFSPASLTQLMRLPSAFRERHNRDLNVLTDQHDYTRWYCHGH